MVLITSERKYWDVNPSREFGGEVGHQGSNPSERKGTWNRTAARRPGNTHASQHRPVRHAGRHAHSVGCRSNSGGSAAVAERQYLRPSIEAPSVPRYLYLWRNR